MNKHVSVPSVLQRKAVLVSLNISTWAARKLDRKVTRETNQRYHAAADAGRFNKLLIEAARLKEINGCVSRARDLYYSMTKPWADEGQRILPNALYLDFVNQLRVIKQDFEKAAEDFCREYPSFVAERKSVLNGMFNEADYPTPGMIRGKFKLEHRFSNLPAAGDFRSDDLDAETVEDIRAEIEKTTTAVEHEAMAHTKTQIVEVVGHMAKKLGEYKSEGGDERRFFFDSLVDNIRDLVKLLPAFNLTGDTKLDALIKRIDKELCSEDAKVLRKNDDLREGVRKSAEDILAEVERVMA